MKRLTEIEQQKEQTEVVLGLTRAFEGMASMRITQVKDQTLNSSRFFADLWQIYRQIKVGRAFHFGRNPNKGIASKKELLVLITSEGSLSGDIDERLVKEAVKYYKPDLHDMIVIGNHGIQLLNQRNIKYIKSFRLPVRDEDINITSLLSEVQKYESTMVFWQNYLSVMVQEPKTMHLATAMFARGENIEKNQDIISERNYIFEPSTFDVVSHLENTMVEIMLSELILESKLAQYASRFKAMSSARQRAVDTLDDVVWIYNLTKRRIKDEQLKSIINGLRKPQI